jgi:tRNA (cmo5U34)-methyltransferase
MQVDKNIKSSKSNWEFDKNVVKSFDSHVVNSVPFYKISHEMVIRLSEFFLKKKSTMYDLGSSTGKLLNEIQKKNKSKDLDLIGLDNSKEMVKIANKRNKKKNLKFKYLNLKDQRFKKCDMITALYTIQFLEPKYRQKLFDKIYKSLKLGWCVCTV